MIQERLQMAVRIILTLGAVIDSGNMDKRKTNDRSYQCRIIRNAPHMQISNDCSHSHKESINRWTACVSLVVSHHQFSQLEKIE